ncbi:response regulator [Candidatus Saccharibacteria bacterium]|nr:response regulator [Candidatus Saccharibacteria bacterium]
MSIQNEIKSIVIVEDNFALSDVYKTRLEMQGYSCFVAYDGLQALAVIEKELPDLVLLDLMVPKVAGDQILERMRESTWGKNIKVMIISNLNEADAPAGLRNLGIEAYAVKANLRDDQLDQLVDAILKPANQVEDVVLGSNKGTEVEAIEKSDAQQSPPLVNDPMSGTRHDTEPDTHQTPPDQQSY